MVENSLALPEDDLQQIELQKISLPIPLPFDPDARPLLSAHDLRNPFSNEWPDDPFVLQPDRAHPRMKSVSDPGALDPVDWSREDSTDLKYDQVSGNSDVPVGLEGFGTEEESFREISAPSATVPKVRRFSSNSVANCSSVGSPLMVSRILVTAR